MPSSFKYLIAASAIVYLAACTQGSGGGSSAPAAQKPSESTASPDHTSPVPEVEIARSKLTVEDVEEKQHQLEAANVCTFVIKEGFSGEEYKTYTAEADPKTCVCRNEAACAVSNQKTTDLVSSINEVLASTTLRKTAKNRLTALLDAATKASKVFEEKHGYYQKINNRVSTFTAAFKEKTGVDFQFTDGTIQDDRTVGLAELILDDEEAVKVIKAKSISAITLIEKDCTYFNCGKYDDIEVDYYGRIKIPKDVLQTKSYPNNKLLDDSDLVKILNRQPEREVLTSVEKMISDFSQKNVFGITIASKGSGSVPSLREYAISLSKIYSVIDGIALKSAIRSLTIEDYSYLSNDWCSSYSNYDGTLQVSIGPDMSREKLLSCFNSGKK